MAKAGEPSSPQQCPPPHSPKGDNQLCLRYDALDDGDNDDDDDDDNDDNKRPCVHQ